MQRGEKNVVALRIGQLMSLEETVVADGAVLQVDKLTDITPDTEKSSKRSVYESVTVAKDGPGGRGQRFNVISKCVNALLVNSRRNSVRTKRSVQARNMDPNFLRTNSKDESGEVPTQLNEEEADELFEFIDSNDDGNIDFSELKKFVQLKGMNPTLGQFNDFLTEKGMDTSGEISLSKEEFISLASEMMAILPPAEEELDSALNDIDTSGDGVISKDELRDYLTNRGDEPITVEEFDALMGECGVNEDDQTIPKGVLKGLLLGTSDASA